LERRGRGWAIRLREGGSCLEADWVVVAAGLGSAALLEPLGHRRPLEPVLGQALELEFIAEPASPPWREWPGAVVWRGWNLVPCERASGGQRLWLGATLEPGTTAEPDACQDMRRLGGDAPAWMEAARIVRHWQGLRARPVERPAPLLEELEPGLLLASGHYRNGVLLAPASAEWVAERIEAPL
jgi:glycine/D-amino acid oxidase-like deaminating enzyme